MIEVNFIKGNVKGQTHKRNHSSLKICLTLRHASRNGLNFNYFFTRQIVAHFQKYFVCN